MRRRFFGLIILAIGVMMVLRTMGVADFWWFFNGSWHKYIIPAVIIIIGIKMILSSNKQTNKSFKLCEVPESEDGAPLVVSAAFSGSAYNFNGEDFHGAKLDAFLGGITVDLRGADIADDCVIFINAFMGGVEIKLPQDVKLEINSSCLIGGVSNKVPQSFSSSAKTLRINANCFLGGVNLKTTD